MKQVDNAKCLICSYSQLAKHVSWLAVSAINDDRRCRSGRDRRWFGRTASPASKAFNKSRPRRLRHLMSLVLPPTDTVYRQMVGFSKVSRVRVRITVSVRIRVRFSFGCANPPSDVYGGIDEENAELTEKSMWCTASSAGTITAVMLKDTNNTNHGH